MADLDVEKIAQGIAIPLQSRYGSAPRWVVSTRIGISPRYLTPSKRANMTVDKSLKTGGRLSRSRNVLKRGERIEKLKEQDRWTDNRSPFGLPKVKIVKVVIGKKKKKKEDEEEK